MLNSKDVFLIAEIGGNHEGDIKKARDLMHLAIDSGADAIKFQVYTGNTLVNMYEDPSRVAHFDSFALKDSDYITLAEECRECGADFNASIWNERQIHALDPYLSFYKIGSGDLTAFPLIKTIVSKKKPIVLSTGLSNLNEIKRVIKFIYSLSDLYKQRDMLVIMQCTSMYPIPDKDTNLNVIKVFCDQFPHLIGYSDHTQGSAAVRYALALGAKIIEVHFTDEREGKEFRDHKVSFTPSELREFKKESGYILEMLGDGVKRPMLSEIESGHTVSFRRALYARRDIKAGEIIYEKDIVALRPMHGLCASEIDKIIGKRLLCDLKELSRLDLNFFE